MIKKYTHIIIAVFLGMLALLGVWYYTNINTPTEQVVVAKTRLSVGTIIGPQHIKVEKLPKTAVPPDAITDTKDVLGKTIYLGTLLEGDVIRKQHIETGNGGVVARIASLAPGKQACDLPAETAPGLKGVAIGDKVDVYTEVGSPGTPGKEGTTALMVQRVAAGATVIDTPNSEQSSGGALSGGQPDKGAYIIAVTPDEAIKVAEGVVRGKKFSVFILPGGGNNG